MVCKGNREHTFLLVCFFEKIGYFFYLIAPQTMGTENGEHAATPLSTIFIAVSSEARTLESERWSNVFVSLGVYFFEPAVLLVAFALLGCVNHPVF